MSERTGIPWLIERNVFGDGNPERIASIVRARGMPCVQVAYECAGGDESQLRPSRPVPFLDDEPVFVYGSMNLCRWLLRGGKWPRLAWYDFDRLRCQSYYAHWGEFLLQQEYTFLPLAEVHRRREWLFHNFGFENRIFIRPDDNAKSFAGGLVEYAGFDQWWELANFYQPGPACLAVVARPQSIEAEWRLVIAQRRFVTGSQYRVANAEHIAADCPSDVAAFAQQVANATVFDPHPVYVMDICRTRSGYRLLEIGSICCASLYACDLERVVTAVTDAMGRFS